jgi:Putative transposase
VVYAKAPFAGPKQVLGYLARYTHRVAISNRRLVALDHNGEVSFRWKDYRANGRTKPKLMRLPAGEFMRRFLLHVLPDGFHRVRHYGLFANGHRTAMLARCRALLDVSPAPAEGGGGEGREKRRDAREEVPTCPCCGGPMRVIERLPSPTSRHYPARKPDGW